MSCAGNTRAGALHVPPGPNTAPGIKNLGLLVIGSRGEILSPRVCFFGCVTRPGSASLQRDDMPSQPPFGRTDQLIMGDPNRVEPGVDFPLPIVQKIEQGRKVGGEIIFLPGENLQERGRYPAGNREFPQSSALVPVVSGQGRALSLHGRPLIRRSVESVHGGKDVIDRHRAPGTRWLAQGGLVTDCGLVRSPGCKDGAFHFRLEAGMM